MTSKQLKDIIEAAGYETRTYSGRGMYGKQCLAFTVDGREGKAEQFAVAADLSESRPPGRDSFRPAGASLVSTISAAPSGDFK